LLGAIGANAANAIINAVIYIMNSAFERNRQLRIARVIASNPDTRHWQRSETNSTPILHQ
jgi:hypothetical protein